MLLISFFSSMRRLWLPTGISGSKGFHFETLQGQYIYNDKDESIYPLDIRCGWQNEWRHLCPLYLILGFEGNSLASCCLPEGKKRVKMRVCAPQPEQRISGLVVFWGWTHPFKHRKHNVDRDGCYRSTYEDHFNVAALKRLEKVCNPSFQTCSNEDPFVEVI